MSFICFYISTFFLGWFYGPDVSLMDCFGCFFQADELKGDNMYRCEKCKMLRNGLKYSQVNNKCHIQK